VLARNSLAKSQSTPRKVFLASLCGLRALARIYVTELAKNSLAKAAKCAKKSFLANLLRLPRLGVKIG
jgi:hypothetical protein